MNQPASPNSPVQGGDRSRVAIDLSPTVAALLDHVAAVTGTPKAQIVSQALLDALPELLERAEGFDKRGKLLQQAKPGGKR